MERVGSSEKNCSTARRCRAHTSKLVFDDAKGRESDGVTFENDDLPGRVIGWECATAAEMDGKKLSIKI
jgi:hypothetical protein